MDQNEINDRVARGAALLGVMRPGWHNTIDSDALDLGSALRCVLGQVYGSYSSGLIQLDIYGEGGAHGFLCSAGNRDCTCGGLETAWLARIAALRNEQVQVLLSHGWLLSRDSLAVISPATGREIDIANMSEQHEQLLAAANA